MPEQTSRVSLKGQITLPAEFRRRLGLKARERVAMTLANGAVIVRPLESGLRAGYRSIPALRTKRSLRELAEIAAEESAEEAAREGL